MSVRLFCLCAVSALAVSACATNQENPNYKYSTKYKAATPYQTASQPAAATTQPVSYVSSVQTATTQPATYVQSQAAAPIVYQPAAPIVYQSAQAPMATTNAGYATRVDEECLRAESKRELIGGALGGTVGAIAGKKLVGGTKGTLIGAAVGGTAGYGLGDKSINCDPIPMAVTQTSAVTQQPYQGQTYQQPYAAAPTPAPAQQVQMPQVQAAPQTYMAPTDQAYGETIGTPGYHAMMAAQGQVQPQPQAYAPQQPVYAQPQTAYAQPQPTYAQPQPSYAPQQPASAPPQPVYQPSQATMTQASAGQHIVVEGDTVYSMARNLCVGVEDIQRINNLNASYNIQLGQALLLPAPRC